jgi:hypothetical protein
MAPKTSLNTDPTARKRTRRQTQASTSTQQPEDTQIPTHPITYQRFKSVEAEERFQEIKEHEFVGERAFDITNLTGHMTFEPTLREKGWEGLNAMVTKTSNKSIALEFFANAYVEAKSDYVATVMGIEVSYVAQDINSLLGLTVLQVCDVERRKVPLNWPKTHEEWDELLEGIMKEGYGWRRKTHVSNPQRINTAHLLYK